MKAKKTASIRFYEELNDFLPKEKIKKDIVFHFFDQPTVKDIIESFGVPHTEVDLILVNGKSVEFDYHIKPQDRISVYPKFESLDIQEITKLRQRPLRNIKFILDVHLGKLAKYLRLLGFDTIYQNKMDDASIVNQSKTEHRIILTRDIGILKHNEVQHGYYVRSDDPKKQIKEIIQRFDLKDSIDPFSRCLECNGV
ncbi:MAG: Mut7-C RNAse domain-containing protein, partial [Bacteroidota bacterium]